MADNYLEKKMEEFQSGKKKGLATAGLRPALRYRGVTVLLHDLDPEMADTIARTLKLVGVTVLATGKCGFKSGDGVRIYPEGTDIASDLEMRHEGLTHVITKNAAAIEFATARYIVLGDDYVPDCVVISGGVPSSIAALMLSAVNPACTLKPQVIKL